MWQRKVCDTFFLKGTLVIQAPKILPKGISEHKILFLSFIVSRMKYMGDSLNSTLFLILIHLWFILLRDTTCEYYENNEFRPRLATTKLSKARIRIKSAGTATSSDGSHLYTGAFRARSSVEAREARSFGKTSRHTGRKLSICCALMLAFNSFQESAQSTDSKS